MTLEQWDNLKPGDMVVFYSSTKEDIKCIIEECSVGYKVKCLKSSNVTIIYNWKFWTKVTEIYSLLYG